MTAISPGFQFTQQTNFLVDDLELVDTVQHVDVTVQGPGRVTSEPAGITCPTTCAADFALGSTVTLTATATGKGRFTGWSGACTGTAACTVTMTEARSVLASFLDPANPGGVKHKLTVAFAGAGKGSIASRAPKISCKRSCNVQILENTKVRLTAKARRAPCSSAGRAPARAPARAGRALKNVKVTAKFEPLKPRLRIIKTGSGSVASGVRGIACGKKCSATFVRGTKVTLVAKPTRGWRFVKWGGACTGTRSAAPST